jgi:hypothetical protein
MEPSTIGRVAFAPFRWATGSFNRWTKRRGSDRLALMRAGSEALTPMMELARKVGPAGIMWGDRNEIDQRFSDGRMTGSGCARCYSPTRTPIRPTTSES